MYHIAVSPRCYLGMELPDTSFDELTELWADFVCNSSTPSIGTVASVRRLNNMVQTEHKTALRLITERLLSVR